jgi:hypothetical protein
MSTTFVYRRGAELPGLTLPWQEQTGAGTWANLDLSSGYTFTLTLVGPTGTVALTKTTGITGADGSVVVAWAVNDLDLAAGDYTLRLRAREVATSKDRDYSPQRPLRISIVGTD